MIPSTPQLLVCPILIGRVSTMAVLDNAIRQVKSGVGACILVSGEAGLGKSRLVTELRARVAVADVDLFQGNCYASDQTIPYAPITDLYRDRSEHDPKRALLDDAADQAARLIDVLPELAQIPTASSWSVPLDPASQQRRLFEALVDVLIQASARRPVVVVVEDVHWIDEGSLAFLLFAIRHTTHHPVVFVLTYRPDDAAPELRHALSEIDRGRLGIDLRLTPLDKDEVGMMVQAIFDLRRPVRPDVLSRLFDLTDGNPFFVEEILKAPNAAGPLLYADVPRHQTAFDDFPTPRSVVDIVQRRLRSLTPQAKQTIALAAVAGRQFDFEIMRIALDRDEASLLDTMRELIAAQLVVEESADRFAFRHALTRQAVFADLLVRERRALHRTLLATLEAQARHSPEALLADLAYHAFEAGQFDRAVEYSRRAGDAAQEKYAPHAAIAHYTRALEAAVQGDIAPPVDVVRQRGVAYRTVGNFDAALADFDVLLHLVRTAGQREAECQALVELGFHWSERDYAKTHAHFSAALNLARDIGQPILLATCLNRLGNWHMNRENPDEALRFHREALALFEAEKDRRGIADTLGLLAITNTVSGDPPQALRWFDQTIEVCRELDDRAGTAFGLAGSLLCCPISDMETVVPSELSLAAGIERTHEAIRLTREIGWRSGEVFASLVLVYGVVAQGDYRTALSVGSAALALADDIVHHQWMVACRHVMGRLFLDLFDYARARACLEPALALARTIDSPFWVHNVVSFLASVAVADGALDEAEAMLDQHLPLDTPMIGAGQRTSWCARADLALARHQPAAALAIADRLFESAGGTAGNCPVARLWKLRGDALLRLGRADDAVAALDLARAAALTQDLLPLLWRIDLSRVGAYRARRQYVLADEAAAHARSTIDTLAAQIPDDDVRGTFRSGATAQLMPPSQRRADRLAHDGLTARETEVAALIARGLTNRSIAEALVLSEGTVETHVKHILSKLGVASRAGVAAWAARKDLT